MILNCIVVSFLLIVTLYLAFQIRKVKVKGLNDAKYTAIIVCINIILGTVLVIVYYIILNVYASLRILYACQVAINWILATAALGLMFIPKVAVSYYYNRFKKYIYDKINDKSSSFSIPL